MPQCLTQHFGIADYQDDSIVEFPAGVPGFERETRFLALELSQHKPVVFLQSLTTPDLCFVTLPILVVEPGYRLYMAAGDVERLGLPGSRPPRIGQDVLCLAILTIKETGTTANLLAPVVVNLKNRMAVQAVAPDGGYSHQHPLGGVT